MKKILLLFIIVIAAVIGLAHEFWLQPKKFFYSIREVANIKFLVGENFTGENWVGNKEKIQELLHYTPTEDMVDISAKLTINKGDSLQLPLQEEGTHMITFQSTNSFLNLTAEKFNEYLLDDGLDYVTKYRKEKNEAQTEGKEYYQRNVKTIIQVSGKLTDQVTKPTHLPLDIIPEENPYAVPSFDSRENAKKIKFKVLFKKVPLKNALVKIWYHSTKNIVIMDSVRTNKNGYAITNRHSGPFMVSCVFMERNRTDSIANWQSYWGSLHFEYPQYYNRNGLK